MNGEETELAAQLPQPWWPFDELPLEVTTAMITTTIAATTTASAIHTPHAARGAGLDPQPLLARLGH